MYGTRVTTSLREKCVERVRSKFPFLLNALYYGQYLSDSAVKQSKKILDSVRQQYLTYINEVSHSLTGLWDPESLEKKS